MTWADVALFILRTCGDTPALPDLWRTSDAQPQLYGRAFKLTMTGSVFGLASPL